MMQKFLMHILDFIFPPKAEEMRLRTISPKKFNLNVKSASKTEFPFIYSLFSYKDPIVKELIWQIKYKKNKHALEIAGYAIYNELIKKYNNTKDNITLIPIPISKQRRKERGYNQVELIINEIIKFDSKVKFNKDFNLLIRIRDIEKQTFKNKEERIHNTEHIFKVQNKVDVNQKIIIIDDVTTTGSTLKEAREELLKNDFNNVECLTIAH